MIYATTLASSPPFPVAPATLGFEDHSGGVAGV